MMLMIRKIVAVAVVAAGEDNDEDDGTDDAVIVVEKYSLKYKVVAVILAEVKYLNDNIVVVYYADVDEYSDYCGNYCCRRKKDGSVVLAVAGS